MTNQIKIGDLEQNLTLRLDRANLTKLGFQCDDGLQKMLANPAKSGEVLFKYCRMSRVRS